MDGNKVHKEGVDRTEVISTAASLIHQMANNQNINIDAVRDRPPSPIASNPQDESHWRARKSDMSADGEESDSGASVNDTSSSTSSVANWNNRPAPPSAARRHTVKLSPKAEQAEKAFRLWKYNKCNLNGRYSPVHLDMNNTLEEIEEQLVKVQLESKIESVTDTARSFLTATVGFLENTASKQTICDFRLNGWSELVAFDIESGKYDAVVSDIYEEWKGSFKPPPIIQLICMIGASAAQFSIMNRFDMTGKTAALEKSEGDLPEPSFNVNDIVDRMRKNQMRANSTGISEVDEADDQNADISSSSHHSPSPSPSPSPERQASPSPPPQPPQPPVTPKKRTYKRKDVTVGIGRGKGKKMKILETNTIEILPDPPVDPVAIASISEIQEIEAK